MIFTPFSSPYWYAIAWQLADWRYNVLIYQHSFSLFFFMGTCSQVPMVLSFARKRLVERTVEAVGVRETKERSD